MCVPGGVCRAAFSIRLSVRRWRSSRTPGTTAARASIESSWSSAIGPSSEAASSSTSARSVGPRDMGSAGVRAREQQQVADEPAHPPGRAQRGLGGVGLLVRRAPRPAARGSRAGWSAACAARARRPRRTPAGARARHASRRARRRAIRASRSTVRASSATSSSASGAGRRSVGSRVRSISRAASVSCTIGRIARAAVARPPSSASTVPPSTPSSRITCTRAIVWSTSDSGRA